MERYAIKFSLFQNVQLSMVSGESILYDKVPCGVELPVQVSYGDDLATYKVVESVDTICVDETIADPASCLHWLLNLPNNLAQQIMN